MRIKLLLLPIVIAVLLMAGCASKGYVDTKLAEMQALVTADVNKAKAQSEMNADEIRKLQATTAQLSEKTDMALNQAKGYENYRIIWEGVISFDFDSFELTQVAKDDLEGLGQKMIDIPRSILEIDGHTDMTGSQKYNFLLALKRAESVKTHMVDQFAIALYRMFVVSHGESKPVAMPDEKNANTRNRRVVLKLWGEL